MGRKIYADMMSQPSRACVIFCRAADIHFELVPVFISKGQHLKPEYRTLNPLGKLPCLVEGDFSLGESAAILRYLANTNPIDDHWYPAEPKARAKVDCALDWHHSNVRRGCAGLVWNRVLAHNVGQVPSPQVADQSEKLLIASLKTLESFWLAGQDFVAGNEISIADLLIVTELDMLQVLVGAHEGLNEKEILAPFPQVRAWMSRVSTVTSPYHAEASAVLQKAARSFAKKRSRL